VTKIGICWQILLKFSSIKFHENHFGPSLVVLCVGPRTDRRGNFSRRGARIRTRLKTHWLEEVIGSGSLPLAECWTLSLCPTGYYSHRYRAVIAFTWRPRRNFCVLLKTLEWEVGTNAVESLYSPVWGHILCVVAMFLTTRSGIWLMEPFQKRSS
jgi:hypothetical protein